MVWKLIEAVTLASALSMDAFVAGFAYGSKKIKIPFKSVLIINLICSSIIGLALVLGTLAGKVIPQGIQIIVCSVILMILGMVKLLDSITKSIIIKYGGLSGNFNFSILNFRFVLNVYADPEVVDADHSKTISALEATSLALALSLDGITVGFGAAIGNFNGFAVVIASLLTNQIAIMLGGLLGTKAARKIRFNISWLSGILLILLAIQKMN